MSARKPGRSARGPGLEALREPVHAALAGGPGRSAGVQRRVRRPLQVHVAERRDLSEDAQEMITDQIDDVMEEIEDNREDWIARTSETEWRLARQSAVMLDQFTLALVQLERLAVNGDISAGIREKDFRRAIGTQDRQ